MVVTTEYAIIGGGIIGLMTARELCLAGADVTIIDHNRVGNESSWAGGGILSPLYPWRQAESITALTTWSQQHYSALIESLINESGIDPEYTRSGLLIFDHSNSSEILDWSVRHSQVIHKQSQIEVKDREPQVILQAENAYWMPQVAQIRPPRLMKALKQSLLSLGVNFLEHCETQELSQQNDHIATIHTTQGKIAAECVIIATGAWSNKILQCVGMNIPIEPVRGQMILFQAVPGLLHCIPLYRHHYLIPRIDGKILAGSTVEYVGFDKRTTEEGVYKLKEAAFQLLPDLRRYPIETEWAGLRPGSPDGIPFIGQHPHIQNLYINAGHFRNGITMAPASARLLVNLIMKQEPIVDSAPYTLQSC